MTGNSPSEQRDNPFCEWCVPEADKLVREIARLKKIEEAARQFCEACPDFSGEKIGKLYRLLGLT